ncbi:hypothetical protein WJX74_001415 [Apatococcus lobatus]|uniref:Uncharacterized protein n=1 Tax=Apatococcus lobatus TaxID=904363 RepID=A0AAW1RIN0_9CHLO
MRVRPAIAAVEQLVGALHQVQAAMVQLTASVTNLLRLKDWILQTPAVVKALHKDGLIQLVATCAEVLLSKELLTSAMQELAAYALPTYQSIYCDHSGSELAWQRIASRTKEKLKSKAILKQRFEMARMLRAYEDEDYRKQFMAYLESTDADIEMRKFTPTKSSRESRPSVSSRPLTPTSFAMVDGQAVPIFGSEPQPAASIISNAANIGFNLNSLLAAGPMAAAATRAGGGLPLLSPMTTSPMQPRHPFLMQGMRQAPRRNTLSMHSVPFSDGPQLSGQLLPNLPLQPQPQTSPTPGFTPYHPIGPGYLPPMQLHFKHQAGIPIPHTNIPLQQYVDDVLHHRRGSTGEAVASTPLASQASARPRDIAAVGRTALRLHP